MAAKRMRLSNTEYERIALAARLNVSDGHAKHTLSSRQWAILAQTRTILESCMTRSQYDLEHEFLSAFFAFAHQPGYSAAKLCVLNYSASCAIKLAAQYCRIREQTKVVLIEPCFDNIRHLISSEGLDIIPIRESQVIDGRFMRQVLDQRTTLWIVQPNNPTGFCLTQRAFRDLVQTISNSGATFVVDFCFRAFASSLLRWDQYRMLTDSGIPFICFEDTGKTWAVGGAKIGITLCSHTTADVMYKLHDELLLDVGTLPLALITEFIKDSLRPGERGRFRAEVAANRQEVHSLVEKGLVQHRGTACQNVPLELLALPRHTLATSFWTMLRDRGVEILPAHNYYWSKVGEGKSLFRIALSRPRVVVNRSVHVICRTLKELVNT